MQQNLNPVVASLSQIRRARMLVVLRAVRVRAVLEELDSRELWLNYASAREAVLAEGWSWSSHVYASKADYAKILDNLGLPDKLGVVDNVHGIKVLKLKPFANDCTQTHPELGLAQFAVLGQAASLQLVRNVVVPEFRDGEESLCDWEVMILKKAIYRHTLELVNALRDIESSVKHLLSLRETGLQSKVPVAIVAESPAVDAMLYRLLSEATLGFAPTPASYPSYGSERINVLPALPETVLELENEDLMVA
jgi:hypothetical protein